MHINGRVAFAIAVLAYSQYDWANVSAVSGIDFDFRDMISTQWIQDLKPGRESATDIKFEAFEIDGDPEDDATDEFKASPETPEVPDLTKLDLLSHPLLHNLPPGFRRHLAFFILFLFTLMIYALLGYYRNYSVVRRSAMVLQPILDEHFAYLADQPTFLEVCSWNKFRIFASGRTSCNTLSIRFNMVKRQCPWHEWILSRLFKSEDVVTMELWLPKMSNIVFAITQKMTNKEFVETHEEIAHTTHVYNNPNLPNTHRAYINSKEKCVTNYASYVIAKCQDSFPQLTALYIADAVPEMSGYRKYNRMFIELKFQKDAQLLAQMLKTAIHLADFTKNYSLQEKTCEIIAKNRQELVTIIYKEDAKRAQEEAKAETAKNAPVNVKKQDKKATGRPTQRIKIIR
ncbi:putative membrane protein [Babesia divergens]|uniref:Membrane protein n=1 Tax=Babesia divergens TaxID=32595 RepID=A0AAD9LDU8_BABDI|nr:putative membrane protein [Babesia divergens]